jgi:hypothetical protein
MGDEYVLELFGRSGNNYAKSAISKIKTMLKRNPDIAPQVMDKMREHMEDIATKAIHSGTTEKYTSINTKTGYIEFRSPGGDWLDSNFSKIEDTLMRFTVALSAAIDPEAYRQEYLKKLYKLLEDSQEKGGPDVLQLFANYSAGELDKAALIRQVRQKQLARNVDKGKVTGKMWWSVGRPGYFASVEVVATSKEEAIAKGKREYPDWANAQDVTAKPLRPYQEPEPKPVDSSQGNWGIWIGASQRFARAPGQIDNNVLRRFPSREAAEQFITQAREQNSRMRSDVEVREIEPAQPIPGSTLDLQRQRAAQAASTDATQGGIVDVGMDVAQNFPAQAPQTLTRPGQPQQQFTGEWQVLDPQDREIYRFSGIGNNQSDANRVAMNWLRQNPGRMQAGVTVVPVMG